MPARGRRTRDLCTRAEIKDFEERRNARAGASYPRPGQQVFVALALRRVEMPARGRRTRDWPLFSVARSGRLVEMPARGRRTRDVMQVDLRDMKAAESKCPRGGVVPATRTSVSILRWRRTVEMPARGRRTRDWEPVGRGPVPTAPRASQCPRGGVVPATAPGTAPRPPCAEVEMAPRGGVVPATPCHGGSEVGAATSRGNGCPLPLPRQGCAGWQRVSTASSGRPRTLARLRAVAGGGGWRPCPAGPSARRVAGRQRKAAFVRRGARPAR